MTSVRVTQGAVEITDLDSHDPALSDLLSGHPQDRWSEVVERALAVGARGLLTMGLGIDLTDLDAMVRRSVQDVLTETRRQVEEALLAARNAFAEDLDPERRASVVARALQEMAQWREGFLDRVDPSLAGSDTARFLRQIEELVGAGGTLEIRLREILDPDADGAVLGSVTRAINRKLDDLRDLIAEERGRRGEASKGTQKGFDFEDRVEEHVREAAGRIGGCRVDRTSKQSGRLSGASLVGDLTVTLPTGKRVVVEVKDVGRISLSGRDGILDELDRALTNREADFAICVSAQHAYPSEVGAFGCYSNKLLVVSSNDGTIVDVALRWAAAALASDQNRLHEGIDPGALAGRLSEIRNLAQLFSTNRRSLTEIGRSLEGVQASLGEMRSRLLGLCDELMDELGDHRELEGAEVVELPRP